MTILTILLKKLYENEYIHYCNNEHNYKILKEMHAKGFLRVGADGKVYEMSSSEYFANFLEEDPKIIDHNYEILMEFYSYIYGVLFEIDELLVKFKLYIITETFYYTFFTICICLLLFKKDYTRQYIALNSAIEKVFKDFFFNRIKYDPGNNAPFYVYIFSLWYVIDCFDFLRTLNGFVFFQDLLILDFHFKHSAVLAVLEFWITWILLGMITVNYINLRLEEDDNDSYFYDKLSKFLEKKRKFDSWFDEKEERFQKKIINIFYVKIKFLWEKLVFYYKKITPYYENISYFLEKNNFITLFDNLVLKINNKLTENINLHFSIVWPIFFYVSYSVMFDVPDLYLLDFYMIISLTIIFFNLLFLMVFSDFFSKEINVLISNQLFYISVGGIILLFSYASMIFDDILFTQLFFLSGHFLISSGTLFFKFWVIFFFTLCAFLTKFFVKQSLNSLLELPLLLLVAGVLLLVIGSLTDIFAIVLSFEILSLTIIGLCGLSMNKISTEASIKYFSQNSIITGLVLLGVFFYLFLFKNTNLVVTKLFIEIILNFSVTTYYLNVLLFTSMILWLLSFLFKFGIFPVNFYVADIYNGSSAPVILFISAIIKPAVLFLFYIRVVPLFSEKIILISIVFSFCIASIVLGDWMSLNTSSIKRFFGHSSISQYGFVVLSIFSKSTDIAFYVFLYLFIYNVSLFLIVITLIEHPNFKLKDISNLYFNDLSYYFKYNAAVKLLTTINILIISGLPPFILFLFKYVIFVQIFGSQNYVFLLLIFIFNTGFSSAYYFRIISDIWAINLFNIKLVNLNQKKNLIFENNLIIDGLKIYFFWLMLIFIYLILIKYFDSIYEFSVLIVLNSLIV